MTNKPSKLSDVAHVFRVVAPNILKVVASTNPIAGALISTASVVLGKRLNTDPTPEAITTALANPTPEALVNVRAADADFVKAMGDLEFNLDSLDVQDRQGARAMSTTSGGILQRDMLWWLLIFTSVFVLSFFFLMFFCGKNLSQAVLDALLPTAGSVITQCFNEIKAAYAFAFGGSQDKEALATAVKGAVQ